MSEDILGVQKIEVNFDADKYEGGIVVAAHSRIDGLDESLPIAHGLKVGLFLVKFGKDDDLVPAVLINSKMGPKAFEDGQEDYLAEVTAALKIAEGVTVYTSGMPPWRITATAQDGDLIKVLRNLPGVPGEVVSELAQRFAEGYQTGLVTPQPLTPVRRKVAEAVDGLTL